MSINSITSASSITAPSCSSQNLAKNDLKSLKRDLQGSDLASAQNDFATLLQDAPQLQAQLQAGTASTPSGTASSALSSLSSALQAGDLTSAQTAMANLQQSAKAHHHHHHSNDQDADDPFAEIAQPAGATGSTVTTAVDGITAL